MPYYVSDLIGKLVADVDGERVGRLQDLIAVLRNGMPHPEIVALEIKRSGGVLVVPFSDVAVLIAPAVSLARRLQEIVPYQLGEHDLYLAQDVLDKQIIDTNGMRVVRVNDLELLRHDGHFFVANVDVGSLGLLRRLGLIRPMQWLAHRFGRELRPNIISWDAVEMLSGSQMQLRVSSDKISELHPADLAEIISDLSRTESSRLLESLDAKIIADTLEEVEPDFQASLVEGMADEMIVDVLEEMAPDEAADLLAELPEERSRELLNLMQDAEAKDVRRLLAYPEDTAGGIMTTEYVAISPNLKAEQVVAILRDLADEAETIFYVYVTDDEDRLRGVFSLRDLVLARPEALVTTFMHHRIVSVNLHNGQNEVAQIVAKYNLLAVPVVDDQGRLQGIVTADDALDKIIPTSWKKRLPRLYH